jgi:hypothetical protein
MEMSGAFLGQRLRVYMARKLPLLDYKKIHELR